MAASRIPLPREHGAWAMVVGPALVGLAAPVRSGVPGPQRTDVVGDLLAPVLLLVALLALFCLQYVIVRRITAKRPDPTLPRWTWIYGAVGAGCGAALVFWRGHVELVGIALLAAIYFGVHLYQVRRPGRREHRALAFEILTVAILCLGAPAGALVSGAGLGPSAAWAYILSFGFFAGSVFHVRSIVRRLQRKSTPASEIPRTSLARESIAWHAALALVVGTSGLGLPASGGDAGVRVFLFFVAFAPAIARAFYVARNLGTLNWTLRKVGFVELGCTVAFVVASAILLRAGFVG